MPTRRLAVRAHGYQPPFRPRDRAPAGEPIVAVAAVVSLALWPIEIHRAFGLPAHPLLIHVPVVFIPILGLAVMAVAFTFRWFERYGCRSPRSRS